MRFLSLPARVADTCPHTSGYGESGTNSVVIVHVVAVRIDIAVIVDDRRIVIIVARRPQPPIVAASTASPYLHGPKAGDTVILLPPFPIGVNPPSQQLLAFVRLFCDLLVLLRQDGFLFSCQQRHIAQQLDAGKGAVLQVQAPFIGGRSVRAGQVYLIGPVYLFDNVQ